MRNEFARNLDLAQAKIQYDEQCKKAARRAKPPAAPFSAVPR